MRPPFHIPLTRSGIASPRGVHSAPRFQMKLVMFDMDGTLTDSFSFDENCYLRAIEQALGLANIELDWQRLAHTSSSYWLEEFVRHGRGTPATSDESRLVQQRLIALMDEITARTGRCTAEIRGAAACLRWLRQQGYAVAIASGDWEATARHKLANARIPFEDLPAAFCDTCHPRVEIMRTALRRACAHYDCAQFERVVYVGDGAWDVRACRELGWPLIGVGAGAQAEQLRALGVSHVIDGYEPMTPFLEALAHAMPPAMPASATVRC